MSTSKKILKAAGFALAFGWLTIGGAQAATCTVDTTQNPDPYITGALSTTSCGLGSSNNDSATEFASVTGVSPVALIDRDADAGSLYEAAFGFTPVNGTSGTWWVDLDALSGFDRLFLVLKDGGTGDTDAQSPPEISWVWFELSLTAGTCTSPYDICGEWSMWGNNSGAQTVNNSHMSLYGTYDPERPPPLPEPAILGLLGFGLVGIAAVRRRRAA